MFGSPNIQKLIDKRDIRGLANALSDSDPAIRDRAAQGLIQIDDPASVPLMLDVLLAHQQDAVLQLGVYVLREMGPYSEPALVSCLRLGEPDRRAG